MRFLFINQVFHPDPQSTGQHLSGVASALVQRGHHVSVVTSQRGYDDPVKIYPARETWRGIEVVRVWASGLGHGSKWARAVDFFSFLAAANWRCLWLPRPDTVVTLTTPPLISVLGAGLAKWWWRARFVYWVMDLNPDEAIAVGWLKGNGLLARALDAASRWSLRRANAVIVLDDYMRERVVAKGINPAKITTVPIWMHGDVQFDPIGRDAFRREHGLDDKYVVMYSGNHTPCHPLDTLVEATKLVRDTPRIHFCFVGGGLEWKRLRDRARAEAWPNVTFLGYQPFDALSASLSAADVQVVAMGDAFVGIVHPCKVYNFLAVQRPFVFIGPKRSHITDLIREAGLEQVTADFRHGEAEALARELRHRAKSEALGQNVSWPEAERLARWTEAVAVGKLVSLLERT